MLLPPPPQPPPPYDAIGILADSEDGPGPASRPLALRPAAATAAAVVAEGWAGEGEPILQVFCTVGGAQKKVMCTLTDIISRDDTGGAGAGYCWTRD